MTRKHAAELLAGVEQRGRNRAELPVDRHREREVGVLVARSRGERVGGHDREQERSDSSAVSGGSGSSVRSPCSRSTGG